MMLIASNGIKIGVVGLVEREWLDTINSLPPGLIYKSASATAKELVPVLREQGADIIVAVTHMREPNDVKLATNTPPGLIDIILGGHDHYYNHQVVNGTHILRSGSDFKQLSYIEAWRNNDVGRAWMFNISRSDITRDIPENPAAVSLVEELTSNLRTKLERPIGYTAVPLDGRFTTVRRAESNLGNFICDLMRFYYTADCTIMASGTIRGDQVYPPGVLRIRDIMSCFPFEDPVVCLRVSGSAITAALENGVSNLPALEGRFPQVSNITFEFDISLPAGKRVLWASIGGDPIEPDRKYTLATRGYMARGKDGYASLLIESKGGDAEEIVDEENGLLLSTIVRQYFMGLKVIGRWGRWGKTLDRLWGGVVEKMSEGGSVMKPQLRLHRKRASKPQYLPLSSLTWAAIMTIGIMAFKCHYQPHRLGMSAPRPLLGNIPTDGCVLPEYHHMRLVWLMVAKMALLGGLEGSRRSWTEELSRGMPVKARVVKPIVISYQVIVLNSLFRFTQ
jgi:5'-nucleotidase, C-terminal domain